MSLKNFFSHQNSHGNSTVYDSTGEIFTHRAALLCSAFCIVNYFLVLWLDFIPTLPQLRNICNILFTGITALTLYLIFSKKEVKVAANINIIFLSLFYLPLIWLFIGGVNGAAPVTLFMAAAFNAIINNRYQRNVTLTMQIAMLIVLCYIEIQHPYLVTNTLLTSNGVLGNMLNIFYITIATLMLIVFFIDQNRLNVKQLSESNEQLRKVNEELLQSTQFQRNLIANISHDLNTPITLITGYAQAINDGLLPPSQVAKYLDLIRDKALVLSNLIDDLLQLTQLETGQLKLELAPSAIKDILSNIQNKYQLDVESKGLDFRISPIPPDLETELILIDSSQLNKVFSNLIYNALKFTNEGSIAIACSRSEDAAVFSITDTGVGIAPDVIPFIFKRFYKESSSRNSALKGSGLGLNIAQQIVNLHGGEIWVTSDLGQGSTFSFTVPLQPSPTGNV